MQRTARTEVACSRRWTAVDKKAGLQGLRIAQAGLFTPTVLQWSPNYAPPPPLAQMYIRTHEQKLGCLKPCMSPIRLPLCITLFDALATPWMPWHTVCPRQKSLINCREGLRPCNARNQNHGLRSGYGRPIDLNRDLPPFHTRNVAVPWHFCLSTNVWLHDAVTEGYRKPHGKPRLG